MYKFMSLFLNLQPEFLCPLQTAYQPYVVRNTVHFGVAKERRSQREGLFHVISCFYNTSFSFKTERLETEPLFVKPAMLNIKIPKRRLPNNIRKRMKRKVILKSKRPMWMKSDRSPRRWSPKYPRSLRPNDLHGRWLRRLRQRITMKMRKKTYSLLLMTL